MTNSALDPRKHTVLEAIVDCYNRTAEPVSSQKIVQDYDMGLSAATLRNTMADLEELGYLTHPHTSAGRIPTEGGYRVYVDSLMTDQKLSQREKQFIRDGYAAATRDFEEIMEQTSKILSAISHHIGVVLSPELHESILRRIELISIDSEHILAVLLMASGAVKNQVVPIPKDLSDDELYRINQILNEKLAGLPLKKIRQISQDPVKLKAVFDQRLSDPIVTVTRNTFALEQETHVYIDGTSNFFSHPEFGEVQKIESLFRVLEQKKQIADLLSARQDPLGIQVLIGTENGCEGMEMCSIVRSGYRVRGNQLGTIGVIGPTRMAYPRIVSIVKYTSQTISELFEESP